MLEGIVPRKEGRENGRKTLFIANIYWTENFVDINRKKKRSRTTKKNLKETIIPLRKLKHPKTENEMNLLSFNLNIVTLNA